MRARRNWNVKWNMLPYGVGCRSTLLNINWDVSRMGSEWCSTQVTPECQPRLQMNMLPSVR